MKTAQARAHPWQINTSIPEVELGSKSSGTRPLNCPVLGGTTDLESDASLQGEPLSHAGYGTALGLFPCLQNGK